LREPVWSDEKPEISENFHDGKTELPTNAFPES
jgi:hypothetical protein